ncbi:MAG: S8 family serine peptidase [Pegethrix bostrychoides GSE-TBD4-15B]|jgi:subtilisin family serine protease|uniref:S8 family serine peptidase n=1 Tax=Pegethrix bostrychoides GSE-TBD4-15B TaxID=2839662 RepID=A0A951U501_9CYAN|nr:S8 family serine peptidase [Pegethrix bostrychoides GSE-TBD4-15B]
MADHLTPTIAEPETTGRYLVLLREDAVETAVQALSESVSLNLCSSEIAQSHNAVILNQLGVAVVEAAPEQLATMRISAEGNSAILAIEPEQIVYALPQLNLSADYLIGYRDAINHLVEKLLPTQQTALLQAIDEAESTWGLQATKVLNSCASGKGIKVAVLDTGFDLTHPDFIGRTVTSKSFISGEEVQDGNGHGTHCIGTACGSRRPTRLPRYGVAYNAEIYAGKVLSNQGSGSDSGILQGIEWAIASGCEIISMSLGSRTQVGSTYSQVYETVAQRALSRGTLIVAAAGNDSRRDTGIPSPVSRPANCPSILAVGALDSDSNIAYFSNRGINPDGGQVDIAGPGVNVYSSWPMPTQYQTISGTSMATPHVAGIAALHAEESGLRGQELWNLLVKTARRLALASEDVGAGIVQAP